MSKTKNQSGTKKHHNQEIINFDLFIVIWNYTQNFETPAIHIKIARWIQKSWERGDKKLLLMAFRACGKSTLIGLFCAWLIMHNPSIRILVLAADLPLSRKMVRNVKRIIERHPLTQGLKPQTPEQWGAEHFIVEREVEFRDPTMLARSISANMTGSRAELIICDDVEVPGSCNTREKREALRDTLTEITYILVPGGTQLYVGTPHHYHSIYGHKPRKEFGETHAFLHDFKRLKIPILNHKGQSPWPERYPLEVIEEIRAQTGPSKFASQMLLQPVNIKQSRLNVDLLNFYSAELEYHESAGQSVLKINGKRLISASCFWDPAFGTSDETRRDSSVVAVIFLDEDHTYYLHELFYIKTEASGDEDDEATSQCKQVASFIKRNFLPSIAVEINGIGRFLPGLLRKELRDQQIDCSVQEVSSRVNKAHRILEAFDAPMAARKIHVHEHVSQTQFLSEMRDWKPNTSKTNSDDGLDAVASALLSEQTRIRKYEGRTPVSQPDWRPGVEQFEAISDFSID